MFPLFNSLDGHPHYGLFRKVKELQMKYLFRGFFATLSGIFSFMCIFLLDNV